MLPQGEKLPYKEGTAPYSKVSNNKQLELNRINHIREKFLKPWELQGLFDVSSTSIRDNAIFLIAYYHALRISEVGLLQLSDFKDSDRRLYIHRLKHGISNSYVVKEEVRKAIKRWIAIRGNAPGPLFPSRKTKFTVSENGQQIKQQIKGISKRQLDYIFKAYAQKAKLSEEHWNFHTLRHTCAVNMVDRDIPMKQIQDWLGHTSMQSTLIYANVSEVAREKTAEKFYGEGEKVKIEWKNDKTRKKT